MIDPNEITEILRLRPDGRLHHREGQTIEFKEQFNFAGLGDYFKDFAAFSNNKGGHLIFGVTDSPRTIAGLSSNSIDQFEKIDPERISGFLLECFSGQIQWTQELFNINDISIGVIKINPALVKPIVAKKDEGKENIVKNGEIYYRYAGRSQKIRFPELEAIINKRIEHNNDAWIDLMSKIGNAGPQNAAILNTDKGLIEKGEKQIMVIDDDLINKLSFIKEGEFSEVSGAKTLKLVGDVTPINKIEVVQKVKEDLIKRYPLTSIQVANEVKIKCPNCHRNDVWRIIKENGIKDNYDYSAYNFRSKGHEDKFKATGNIPSGTASIYKATAVEFITNIWIQENEINN